ncbi:MAG: hypothetical protein BA863_10380 [Desulfovibrio sp. S3730MH75]|nr:MAG: hypothetical protein BA863_10380 [Desulfovibrio sp. S3730MH75]
MGKLSTRSKIVVDGYPVGFKYFCEEPNTGLCRIQYRDLCFTLPDILAEELFHPIAENKLEEVGELVITLIGNSEETRSNSGLGAMGVPFEDIDNLEAFLKREGLRKTDGQN